MASIATDLPYAAEAETSLSYDELEVLRNQYYKEIESGHVTTQSKFNYGELSLQDLIADSRMGTGQVERGRVTDGGRQAAAGECTYYIAVGYYKLRNYTYARKFNDLLLAVEPENMQAQSLRQLIDRAVARDGYIGMGILAGATAITGIVAAALIKRATRK
ncbi:fission-related protein [Trichosporon asahii var. asahii CBS 2479]|uniref:Mitochondrial fission 1 protein n=1 Tax=Trichosporon asahii var. asahii (strain ATCC 90039 / CBS 2479 / JCM 2466 / KCTC 7840 / NBRC 103889/ NCYC 2677 / UAMH 7654) TaxID=1186058 RepID=J6F861_TRIAS|nr:fission-related protein [Trichosporon asahii var. asahii CBS 2479]EJT51512.1 fission-related protein [Trichosporon asahii var. asahii CBS 2479]